MFYLNDFSDPSSFLPDCVPDPGDLSLISDADDLVDKMERLLQGDEAQIETSVDDDDNDTKIKTVGAVSGRTALKAMGMKVVKHELYIKVILFLTYCRLNVI